MVCEPEEEGPPPDWPQAPHLIEDTYNVADAVVVGSLLITLLRNNDRVAAACQAQLVNAIAPIRTEPGGPAWRQTIFHPFALTAQHARGDVLIPDIETPTYENARFGDVPLVDAVATFDPETGDLSLFVVNRSIDQPVLVTVGYPGFPAHDVREHLVVTDDDLRASNTRSEPDRVTPQPVSPPTQGDGAVEIVLPPASWQAIRLSP